MMHKTILIFDLDDTLYKEIDFLKSAYKEISQVIADKLNIIQDVILSEMIKNYYNGYNVFEVLINKYQIKDITKKTLILMYRNHVPQIALGSNTSALLQELKSMVFKVGLITDGRSKQQRNKLLALGLENYFDDIIISEEFGSEKPDIKNFKYFIHKYGEFHKFIYVGDNVNKDFITPNKLGWKTICLLDDGVNIHKQKFNLEKDFQPNVVINDLTEIKELLNINVNT